MDFIEKLTSCLLSRHPRLCIGNLGLHLQELGSEKITLAEQHIVRRRNARLELLLLSIQVLLAELYGAPCRRHLCFRLTQADNAVADAQPDLIPGIL